MTEKNFKIESHTASQKMFITGSFLSEIDQFREVLYRLAYQKGSYEDLKPEEFKKEERKISLIMTNCPGGNITNMFACLSILKLVKRDLPNIEFFLYCFGANQSAATLFMTSDVFSKVIIDQHSEFVIHQPANIGAEGKSRKLNELQLAAKSLHNVTNLMMEVYESAAKRRKRGKKTDWKKLIEDGDERDEITAKEMFDMGLCDEIQ